jgi:hypothetical protein
VQRLAATQALRLAVVPLVALHRLQAHVRRQGKGVREMSNFVIGVILLAWAAVEVLSTLTMTPERRRSIPPLAYLLSAVWVAVFCLAAVRLGV